MIYGYIRVSSDKQTVENQRFEINNFCSRESMTIDGWIEETISGTKNFAGYIDLPDGRRWAFAVLVNSAPCKAKQIQPIIEKYLLDVYQRNIQH